MNLGQHILIFGVRVYQWMVSPAKTALFGPLGQCRFEPSCSHYAIGAVRTHGALKGGLLAGWRVCRCHPWGGCGEDPVPDNCSSRRENCRSRRKEALTDPQAQSIPRFSHGS